MARLAGRSLPRPSFRPARHCRLLSTLPARVNVYEVGARDGLQNEKTLVDTATKVRFINMLSATGVSAVEPTAFVHPKWVPQMADHNEIMDSADMRWADGVDYPILVPNMRGFHNAVAKGARTVAVIAIPSETFATKNVNCSAAESVARAEEIACAAAEQGVACRAYVSCALGCPFEGPMSAEAVAEAAARLHRVGCYEISLGDTIGVGTPGDMAALLAAVRRHSVPTAALAVHCHDTYGQALANIHCALQHGVTTVDTSVGGLGGCPFAGPGAAGNVATEDVVYMLNGLGVQSGVDFAQVVRAGDFIARTLGRRNSSRAGVASLSRGEVTPMEGI